VIIDKIKNYRQYSGLGSNILSALEYITKTDFAEIENGRHDIDDDMYLLLSDYETRNIAECKTEAHRKYIDVQFIIKGQELVGYASLGNQSTITDYDEKNDYILYNGDLSFINFHEGMFAIFYPDDLHMPGVGDNNSPIRKAVLKIKLPT